ncbi:PHP domain-containing protein [Lachnospiraceae bacterium ZAX-1]
MIANYHTHTRWCRHGTGEIEDYICAAIACGLEELAMTEHVPQRNGFDSNRMQWPEFDAYNEELDRMILKYRGKIRVRKGFECEYYPDMLDDYRTFRDDYGYELLVLAQHTTMDRRHDSFFLTEPWQLERYATDTCQGLKSGMFDFLAHPDVVICGYRKVDFHVREAMNRIFSICERLHIPVELNANGYYCNRGYPCRAVWELAADYDLDCLINSDAHQPENLAGPYIVACEQMAKELGLRVLPKLP